MAALLLSNTSGSDITPTMSLFQLFGYLFVVSAILILRVLFDVFWGTGSTGRWALGPGISLVVISSMIVGIADLGHILLTVALAFLLGALYHGMTVGSHHNELGPAEAATAANR